MKANVALRASVIVVRKPIVRSSAAGLECPDHDGYLPASLEAGEGLEIISEQAEVETGKGCDALARGAGGGTQDEGRNLRG